MQNDLRLVTIGGGTGTFPVIKALHKLTTNITAVVAASDSGGSTGRIRDEFGFVPVGDLRQSLAALTTDGSQEWISKLLLYRFERGNGLKGHNLGNLILTSLQDMTNSTTEALQVASTIFRLEGKVVPVTENNVQLKIEYQDGSVIIGEHQLDDNSNKKKIHQVTLTPKAELNPVAKEAITKADVIVIGPGDFYASLMAVLVVPGLKQVLQNFKKKIVYITNLMTRSTQTSHMTAKDHLEKIEQVIGRKIDVIVINKEKIPPAILKAYQADEEYPVKDDLQGDPRSVRANLVNPITIQKSENDTAHRSLLRHDAHKLQHVFKKIIFS